MASRAIAWRRLTWTVPAAIARFREEPVAVALRVAALAGVPRIVRRLARQAPRGGVLAAVVASARWVRGDRVGALALAVAAPGAVRARVPLAHAFVAFDRPEAALDLLGPDLGTAGPAALRVRAMALERAGRLGAAQDVARRACAAAPRSAVVQRTARRIEGEVRVRTPGWRPPVSRAVIGPSAASVPAVQHRRPRQQPRVLHLLSNSLPHYQAGYTLRSQRMLSAQRGLGIDAVAVTRAGFPGDHGLLGAAPYDVVDGVPYGRIDPDAAASLPPDLRLERSAVAVVALVSRLRPDVLHPASTYGNALVALAARDRIGLPVVYEVRGFQEQTWLALRERTAPIPERYLLDRARETECMLAADAVVTLGDAMRDEIVARGVPVQRVTVIPNGVNVEQFEDVHPDPRLAASLGLDNVGAVLGYVSSLQEYEGVGHLLEAVALLRSGGRDVAGLIVGDGPSRPALEERARALGLGGWVVFTGRVPHSDVVRYLGLMDLFVVPRTTAQVARLVTPLKPYEAMAAGRALVVSDVPALREFTDDGRTGVSFPAEDATALAAVCASLVDDPVARTDLGAAARAWVRANRRWQDLAHRYEEVYAGLR